MATISLFRLCPALVRMRSSSVPARCNDAAIKAAELLEEHPVIVISGSSHASFDRNCKIGKTRMIHSDLVPLLRKQGVKPAYFDLHLVAMGEDVPINVFSREYFRRFGDFFGKQADVYFFDEAHCFLPRETHLEQELSFRLKFWAKVQELLQENKKIVFITSLHPRNPSNLALLCNEAVLCFFTAPVIELPAQQ